MPLDLSNLPKATAPAREHEGWCKAELSSDAFCSEPLGHWPESLHLARHPQFPNSWITFTEERGVLKVGPDWIPRRVQSGSYGDARVTVPELAEKLACYEAFVARMQERRRGQGAAGPMPEDVDVSAEYESPEFPDLRVEVDSFVVGWPEEPRARSFGGPQLPRAVIRRVNEMAEPVDDERWNIVIQAADLDRRGVLQSHSDKPYPPTLTGLGGFTEVCEGGPVAAQQRAGELLRATRRAQVAAQAAIDALAEVAPPQR